MQQHYILEFTERLADVCDDDGYVVLEGGYEVFLVSTRKLEEFTRDGMDFGAYGYVQRLVEECLAGRDNTYTSRKYSFGDCPEWYVALQPDEGCQDPIRRMEVEVGR